MRLTQEINLSSELNFYLHVDTDHNSVLWRHGVIAEVVGHSVFFHESDVLLQQEFNIKADGGIVICRSFF